VTIGRVVKPHGIRGEVVVEVMSDLPGRFEPGVEVMLGGRPATIASSRPHQGRLLVAFEGVEDRTAAEGLRGRPLEAEPVDPGATDTYLVGELVGMAVVDEVGGDLGTVAHAVELPEAAGYDLLEVVRADGTTWLLPAVDDYVEVDRDEQGRERLRLVDPPAGLVEGRDDGGAG